MRPELLEGLGKTIVPGVSKGCLEVFRYSSKKHPFETPGKTHLVYDSVDF